MIIKDNQGKVVAQYDRKMINTIKSTVAKNATDEEMMKLMKMAGAVTEIEDIHISPELLEQGLRYHSYMRYRILLTRLLPMMKLDIMDYLN